MKNSDILEQSRRANRDEGRVHAADQGRRAGYIAFRVFAAVIGLLCALFRQPAALYAGLCLLFAFGAAEDYATYRFTGQKATLRNLVLGGVAALGFFTLFVLYLVR